MKTTNKDNNLSEQSIDKKGGTDPENQDETGLNNGTNNGTNKGNIRKRKRYSSFNRFLLVLSILLFAAAIVLILWNPVVNYLRSQKTDSFMSQIEEGNATIIVDANALAVSGEEYETFETILAVSADGETLTEIAPTTVPLELPEDVVLTALGRISIEKIDLNIPLLDDADVIPLRYGAGMLADTALPGEEGNFVVLGHRMKAYGSLFNRLDEVAVGDSVVITTLDGNEYTYIVDLVIPKLDPSELIDYIKIDSGSGKQLTLVTCTPTGVGSHRIIVIAHMA